MTTEELSTKIYVNTLTNKVIHKGYSPYIDETTGTWWEWDDTAKEWVDTGYANLPEAPTTDGTYTLKATVSGGTATYSWVLDE